MTGNETEPVVARATAGAEPSDHSLVRRVRGGSARAATELYERYAHRVRALVRARCSAALARRIDPDDIVQSVFHRFFRGVGRGRYDVPPGDELWRLFLVLALNKIRSEEKFHRAEKRDVRLTVRDPSPEGHAAAGDADSALLQLTIDELLERLPASHRAIVEQRMQGHEVAAIAAQTGRSKRTVERILHEVRKKLSELLEWEEDHGRVDS